MKKRIGISLLIILILGIAPAGLVAYYPLPKGVTLEITNVSVNRTGNRVAVGEFFNIFPDVKYSGMPDNTRVDVVLYYGSAQGLGSEVHIDQLIDTYTEYVTGSSTFGTAFSMAVDEAGHYDNIAVGLWTELPPAHVGGYYPVYAIDAEYVPIDAFDVEMSLDVDYPNGNLAVGEKFPVIATVEYSNIPVNFNIEYVIGESESEHPLAYLGLDRYEARPDPIGIGQWGTLSHTFEISLDSPGRQELWVRVGWNSDTIEGGNPTADTVTFLVNIVSLDVPSPSAEVEIVDLDYPKPPDTIEAHERTPIIVEAGYGGLDEGSKLSVSVYDLSTGSFLEGEVSELLAGTGWYAFRPVEVAPSKAGSWALRVEVEATTAGHIVAETTEDISITVVGVETAQVTVTVVDHVKSPDTIAVGESTPVTVTVQYSDLISGSQLILWIKDLDKNVACQGGTSSSIVLSGSGTYTFPRLTIKPSTAGDWHLETEVELSGGTVATKQFTIEVVKAGQVDITNVLHAEPPDTITVGQTTPVTVTIQFQNLPGNSILKAYVNDEDTHTKVGSGTSTPLLGSGTYTFPNIVITPSRAGDWHLTAGVTDYPDAAEAFKVKVVVQAGKPGVQITTIKQPGTLKVGEQAPITVTISYQNLAQGTKLTVILHDYDSHKDLGSATSIALSGTGTYTFSPITIKTAKEGTWRLGVMISGYKETKTDFVINVAK